MKNPNFFHKYRLLSWWPDITVMNMLMPMAWWVSTFENWPIQHFSKFADSALFHLFKLTSVSTLFSSSSGLDYLPTFRFFRSFSTPSVEISRFGMTGGLLSVHCGIWDVFFCVKRLWNWLIRSCALFLFSLYNLPFDLIGATPMLSVMSPIKQPLRILFITPITD